MSDDLRAIRKDYINLMCGLDNRRLSSKVRHHLLHRFRHAVRSAIDPASINEVVEITVPSYIQDRRNHAAFLKNLMSHGYGQVQVAVQALTLKFGVVHGFNNLIMDYRRLEKCQPGTHGEDESGNDTYTVLPDRQLEILAEALDLADERRRLRAERALASPG